MKRGQVLFSSQVKPHMVIRVLPSQLFLWQGDRAAAFAETLVIGDFSTASQGFQSHALKKIDETTFVALDVQDVVTKQLGTQWWVQITHSAAGSPAQTILISLTETVIFWRFFDPQSNSRKKRARNLS